jgi:hypothetical protein
MQVVFHPKVYDDLAEVMACYERVATRELADAFYAEFRYFAGSQEETHVLRDPRAGYPSGRPSALSVSFSLSNRGRVRSDSGGAPPSPASVPRYEAGVGRSTRSRIGSGSVSLCLDLKRTVCVRRWRYGRISLCEVQRRRVGTGFEIGFGPA